MAVDLFGRARLLDKGASDRNPLQEIMRLKDVSSSFSRSIELPREPFSPVRFVRVLGEDSGISQSLKFSRDARFRRIGDEVVQFLD